MKILRSTLLAVALFAGCAPTFAQWQTPNHSVPVGKGVGVTGFGNAAPGAAGSPLISNGASADPSFQQVPTAGIANNAITNALFATAPANTAKCNPTNGVAAVQDCTGAQLITSLGLAPAVNTFTAGHTILPSDCNNTVQMGNGASGQLSLVVPASPLTNGFTGSCPIEVFNGNTYTPGTAGGVILSGALPANQFNRLMPQQSFELKISNGAFVATRASARWMQTGAELHVANGGNDSTNDCLSVATACATPNGASGLLYGHVDNMNSSPIIHLDNGGTWSECDTFAGQLTGVNVGFIEGTGGQALWGTNGACAALLIGDNAEWETANITFTSGTANGSGIFIHQPAVVDLLGATNFGAFSGTGAAIGSDHGGFINFDQNGGPVNIGPGNTGTFMALGPGTQMVGSFTFTGQSTVNVGTFMTITGAGAMANFSGIAVGGSFAGLGPSTCRGPSAFTLGSSLPGGAPTATAGCQSM